MDNFDDKSQLVQYLEASLWIAYAELEQAKHWCKFEKNEYTLGKLQYGKNYVSIVKELLRGAQNPSLRIDRYRNAMRATEGIFAIRLKDAGAPRADGVDSENAGGHDGIDGGGDSANRTDEP